MTTMMMRCWIDSGPPPPPLQVSAGFSEGNLADPGYATAADLLESLPNYHFAGVVCVRQDQTAAVEGQDIHLQRWVRVGAAAGAAV